MNSARLLRSLSSQVLLAAALVAGCNCGGTPAPAVPTKVVAVLGSSTAAGTGASSGQSWVALVQAAAGASCPSVTVANLAYPGYTTAQALPVGASRPAGRPASDTARNLEAALALKPVLVLLQFPSNDAAQSFPLSETLANHTTLRDGVRAAGAVDVIIGPFPRAFTDAPTIALMTGLRDGLPAVGAPRYLPLWTDLAKSDNAVLDQYGYGDGIHVNDAGHRLIADKVIASAAWQAVCTK